MLAGTVMPGSWSWYRGLVCQCLSFILTLKWKAAGHLPSITGCPSNSLLCHKALVHGPACWQVTWQPAEAGREGWKHCGGAGPWFKAEETARPKIHPRPCASHYLGLGTCNSLETVGRKHSACHTDGNFMAWIWAIHKSRLLTRPPLERMSERRFVGGCELLRHLGNEMYKCMRLLAEVKKKQK